MEPDFEWGEAHEPEPDEYDPAEPENVAYEEAKERSRDAKAN